jgi:hypothetical protein
VLALSLPIEIILGWFAFSAAASVLVIVLGSFRGRHLHRESAERRHGPADRRAGPADRRASRPDRRSERFERRSGLADRRVGSPDRRRAPV